MHVLARYAAHEVNRVHVRRGNVLAVCTVRARTMSCTDSLLAYTFNYNGPVNDIVMSMCDHHEYRYLVLTVCTCTFIEEGRAL